VTTTSTSFTEAIPAERIEAALQKAQLPVSAGLAVAWTDVVPKGSSNVVRLIREDGLTGAPVAGTKTEDAEFSLIEHTLSEASCTAGTVGYSARPTYEMLNDSSVDALGSIVGNGMRHLMNRIDSDLLALLTSFTPIASFAGLALTDARVLTALATFHAQNPNMTGQIAFVLNHIQLRDWTQDLASMGAGYLGGDAESARVAQMIGPAQGFKGVKHGLAVIMSTNVPVAGGDASGAIFPMGDMGPIAFRSWREATVQQFDIPRRQSIEITISARYGVAHANPGNGVEVLSDGA
jgi:hypothetical protein